MMAASRSASAIGGMWTVTSARGRLVQDALGLAVGRRAG